MLDGAALTAAAASELASPLVLLRQLGFALQTNNLSDADRQHMLDQLMLTSERALRLTANLNLSMQDQTVLPIEPINPVNICQEVIHELSPLFAAHGQSITLQSRKRIPLSVGNRSVLQRVLVNFVDNALHYGAPDHPIRLSIASHGNSVRIGVRDYGPAVPINLWERLEENIAKKARVPLVTRPQASAVNLLVTKRLADLMGSVVGTIRHRNGTTFYIDLQLSHQMSLV